MDLGEGVEEKLHALGAGVGDGVELRRLVVGRLEQAVVGGAKLARENTDTEGAVGLQPVRARHDRFFKEARHHLGYFSKNVSMKMMP